MLTSICVIVFLYMHEHLTKKPSFPTFINRHRRRLTTTKTTTIKATTTTTKATMTTTRTRRTIKITTKITTTTPKKKSEKESGIIFSPPITAASLALQWQFKHSHRAGVLPNAISDKGKPQP